MTLTMGKRGTIVIPKAIRDACKLNEGASLDISLEDKAIVLLPSITTRTRMDENFDAARSVLEANGVTLEMALAKLTEIKTRMEDINPDEHKPEERSSAA